MVNVIESDAQRSTVLIADDEMLIQQLMVRLIEQLGLIAVIVGDGASAVAVVATDHQKLCCVILDIDMPIMNGIDAARSIQNIAPNLGIVLISGALSRNYDPLDTNLRLSGALHKPFSLQKMREMIHNAVQGA